MKPRSIVSLIVAAALVICGIITCAIASAKANDEGIMLFPEPDADGNLVYRMDLLSAGKITVNTADADITVVGGADKSYIEVINFNANYYKLSQSNGSVIFAQVDDFLSMFKFWENGFSFKGMRYLLRFGDDVPGDKKIVVHLNDSDNIRLVNISTERGDIAVNNCAFNADYTVKSTLGTVDLRNITGAASMSVSGSTFTLNAEHCASKKFSAIADTNLAATITGVESEAASFEMPNGILEAKDNFITDIKATTTEGEIKLLPYNYSTGTVSSDKGKVTLDFENIDSLAANITTTDGKVSVNGEFKDTDGESFSMNATDPKYRINVTTNRGDVYITYPITEEK